MKIIGYILLIVGMIGTCGGVIFIMKSPSFSWPLLISTILYVAMVLLGKRLIAKAEKKKTKK